MATLALVLLGLPVGFLIGLVGIGGVLLAPLLVLLTGRDIHAAVALSLASFVAAGLVAVATSRTANAPLRGGDGWLLGALVPGALAGSLVSPLIPTLALSVIISLCVLFAGISCLRIAPPGSGATQFRVTGLAVMGLLCGLISAVSGTGGPLILVPLLLWSGMEVRRTLAVSQIAQLPIAATATLANGFTGTLDFAAAAVLSVGVVIAMVAGLWVGRRMDTDRLRRTVAWCLVLAGAALVARDLWVITQAATQAGT
jgi:uncharacterized membrane protein YfcA